MTLRSANERWLAFNDDVGTAKSREMYSKHVAITLKEPCYLTMTVCVQSVVPIPRPLSLCFGHRPMAFLRICKDLRTFRLHLLNISEPVPSLYFGLFVVSDRTDQVAALHLLIFSLRSCSLIACLRR